MTATQTVLTDLLARAGVDRDLLGDSPDGETVVVDFGEGEGSIVVGYDWSARAEDSEEWPDWIDFTVYDAEHTIERTEGGAPQVAANAVAKLADAR